MPDKIILLTGKREEPYLLDYVQRLAPDLPVAAYTTKAAFLETAEEGLCGARLISFLSSIIVPGEVLDKLDLTPYNIHPGPPDRPGLFPEAFAAVEGARSYGVTAHEMVAEIDAGPIVALETFDLPQQPTRMTIVEEAEKRAVALFAWLAQYCVGNDADLPRLGISWSGKRTTRADYDRLLVDNPALAADG